MVLIYAILIPRVLKLTGSMVTTTLLGGLTYASMQLVEVVDFQLDSERGAVVDLRPLELSRSRHFQELRYAAHRQRLGPRCRLPRDRTACNHRHPTGGARFHTLIATGLPLPEHR